MSSPGATPRATPGIQNVRICRRVRIPYGPSQRAWIRGSLKPWVRRVESVVSVQTVACGWQARGMLVP
jgi:hypothetical protein